MLKIETTIVVNQEKQKVYEVFKKMEEFPKFMKNVKKLEILEREFNRLVTRWEVDVDGADLVWKEEDIFDDEKLNIRFKMLEGDYQNYEGEWIIEPLDKQTKINLIANIDWGMPNFEKFVGYILTKKAYKSLKGMLKVIKQRCEKS